MKLKASQMETTVHPFLFFVTLGKAGKNKA